MSRTLAEPYKALTEPSGLRHIVAKLSSLLTILPVQLLTRNKKHVHTQLVMASSSYYYYDRSLASFNDANRLKSIFETTD